MTGTTDRDYLKGNEALPACPVKTQYLVLLSAHQDEMPIRLFDTKSEAEDFIANNPPFPSSEDGCNHNCPEVNGVYEVYGRDVSYILGYDLVTLTDGRATARELRWWEDEETGNIRWEVPDGFFINKTGELEEVCA